MGKSDVQLNREAWLGKMHEALRPDFEAAKVPYPEKVKMSCGWTGRGAGAAGRKRIGECWSPKNSKGGVSEIFISPMIANPVAAGAILVHELVHAAIGVEAKHGKLFARAAKALGLEGKMTATHAGTKLTGRLNALVKGIGPYPHAELAPTMITTRKKEGTRMIKVVCPDCGYTIRTTATWLEKGTPTCPCGAWMEPQGLDKPVPPPIIIQKAAATVPEPVLEPVIEPYTVEPEAAPEPEAPKAPEAYVWCEKRGQRRATSLCGKCTDRDCTHHPKPVKHRKTKAA